MRFIVVAAASLASLTGCGYHVSGVTDAAAPAPSTEVLPARTSAAAPTTAVAALGDAVPFEYGGTVGTVMLKRIDRIPGAQGGVPHAPPVNGSFLLVHVRLGISQGTGVADALTFQAQTPDGTIHQAVSGVVQEPLNARRLPIEAGEHVHGAVAFDVPQGDLLISYMPAGTPLATFKIVS